MLEEATEQVKQTKMSVKQLEDEGTGNEQSCSQGSKQDYYEDSFCFCRSNLFNSFMCANITSSPIKSQQSWGSLLLFKNFVKYTMH